MDTNNINLWQHLAEKFWDYKKALGDFFSEKVDRVALIRKGIRDDRVVAIELGNYLSEDEHKQLFDLWIGGASTANGYVHIFRKFILSLPHDWVMERIESMVEPHLCNDDMDEYRRFLELYILLDINLTRKLAERAAAHSDPEIKEAGEDFLEILKDDALIEKTRKGLLIN